MNKGVPVKFLYRVVDERGGVGSGLPLMSVSLTRGVVPRSDISESGGRADDLSNYKVCRPGDIVINRMSAYQGALGLSHQEGLVSPDYLVLRPNEDVSASYLTYVFKSRWFVGEMTRRLRGIGSTEQGNVRTPRINSDDLGLISIKLPTSTEQKAIADYLDIETARIDALIEKKRRMVDLVDEKLVSTCETLLSSDESAPVRLKHFVMKVGSGSTPRGGSDVYVDSGVAFLRSQNIKDGQISHDDVVYITDEDDEILRRTRVKAGDVLLNITGGSIGRTAVARSHDLPANVSQHVCVIRPNPLVSSDLLQAALDSSNVQEQIDLMQVGGNREGLNFEQIRNLMIVLPNPQNARRIEQNLIAERLRLKKVKEFLLAQIDLLVIRRQALITAAVTGEIEVPEVAA
jgi:type I restriction enzyme, S subunit